MLKGVASVGVDSEDVDDVADGSCAGAAALQLPSDAGWLLLADGAASEVVFELAFTSSAKSFSNVRVNQSRVNSSPSIPLSVRF